MIKHILVVFAIFISTTTFSQQLLTQKEKQETEELSESLKNLENLKNKGTITEAEYNELRQSVINKFLSRQ